MKPISLLAALALLGAPEAARACAVCMGASETVGEAMNAAIFVMLGCIFSMLALIGAVAFHFWRRQQQSPAPPLT
jgi:flagellar biogenesis protein FliO